MRSLEVRNLKEAAIIVLCAVIVASASGIATLYYCIETEPYLCSINPFETVVSGYPQFCNSTNFSNLGDETG